ncbi:MAG: M35 family metallo-endopeptidase [Yoonia sp.]|uniref:M35 family metallo-endopeptidase n=1 Tax=Yoonia sp. TaxID=2212373 RepID=UPI003EF47165
MTFRLILVFCFGLLVQPVLAQPALAQADTACTVQQKLGLDAAMRGAKDIALRAAVAVADTKQFAQWFGTYSPENAEQVRKNLKSIVTAIRTGAVTIQCEAAASPGCGAGEYAWVFANNPYLVHICPVFFSLPEISALAPGRTASEHGTREGTVIHELSHFEDVGDTVDHCYSRSLCTAMARRAPARAIENADSYQYFAEDVTYFARRAPADKPPPAPRPVR